MFLKHLKSHNEDVVKLINSYCYTEWIINDHKEYCDCKPVKDLIETINMNHDNLKWYIFNSKVGSNRNRKHKLRKMNTITFSNELWTYICNKTSETTLIKHICEEVDLNKIKKELDRATRRNIGNTKIQWLFYSKKGDDKVHYWGKRNESMIRSTKYPEKTGQLIEKIMKRVKTSVVLTEPSSLVPIYHNETMSLGKHQDTFNGRPEYVINIYVGDDRYLTIESVDGKYQTKVLCQQGLIRIFHPLFNQIFYHSKQRSHVHRKIHYAISIRQAKIQHFM